MISFVQLYILVRHIPQSDFGLMAICTLVISYLAILSQFGLPIAIVQEKKINQTQNTSSLFLLTIGSCLCYLLLILSSGFIADFFSMPAVRSLFIVIGLTLVFDAMGAIFLSHLKRQIAFNKIQKSNMLAAVSYAIVSITMAINNYDIYALIWGFTISNLLKNLSYFYFAQTYVKLGSSYKISSLKELLAFGKYQLANRFTANFTFRLDVLIIGKFLGAEPLGVYEVMKNLLTKPQTLITPILTEISLPVISKIREQKEKVTQIYHGQLLLIYCIVAPIYICLLLNHKTIILYYLGQNWVQYSYVFVVLSVFYLIRISGVPVGSLLLGFGKSKHLFIWNIAISIITATALILYSVSLNVIILILCILQLSFIIPNYIINVKPYLEDDFLKYIRNVICPIIPGALSFSIAFYLSGLVPVNDFIQLIVSLCTGSIIYLILILYLYKFLPEDMIAIFKKSV